MLSFLSDVTVLRIIILILIVFLLDFWGDFKKANILATDNSILKKRLEELTLLINKNPHIKRNRNIDNFDPEINTLLFTPQYRTSTEIENQKLKATISNLEKENNDLKKNISTVVAIKNLTAQKSDLEALINEKLQTYPWLATLYADAEYARDRNTVSYLRYKSRPALSAANHIQNIAKEKRQLITQLKLTEYQLTVYENLFPWLLDYKELSVQDAYSYSLSENLDATSEYEGLKNWLSPEEYKKLPNREKYQRALDRYNSKDKSKWEIGIEYERYVGYMYEEQGYRVNYNGATAGLEDMGRDLIAVKGKDIIVIQCKRWSKNKTIHEKHIFQLYGTVILMKLDKPQCSVTGVFTTTTTLSDTAMKCAKALNLEVLENYPLQSYPQIKCNISKDKTKIYHLPFDQQYDKTKINPKDGDLYVSTVQQAEELGFRHAWKWHDK